MTIVRALKLVSLVFLGTPFVQPVLAQPAVSGSSSDPLCVERDPWNPSAQCQGSGRADFRAGANSYVRPGPIGPIERSTLSPGSDSVIALIPYDLRQTTLPPMWLRVCLTNSANSGSSIWVRVDGETVGVAPQRCVYVAF